MVENETACLTILMVENDTDTRFMMRWGLEARGYRVVEAIDGQEAIESAKRDCPDLILMDVGLPQMDGLAVTRAMRGVVELCDVPIVAVTAFNVLGMEEAARAAGCDAYITKPIDFDELEMVMREVRSGR